MHRGYRCKGCDLEGGKWRQNLEEEVTAEKWREGREGEHGEEGKARASETELLNPAQVTEPESDWPSCKIYRVP